VLATRRISVSDPPPGDHGTMKFYSPFRVGFKQWRELAKQAGSGDEKGG